MKITKRQLKRIIREAMPAGGVPDVVGAATGVYGEKNRRWQDAHARGDLGKNIADADFPIVVGYEGRSEIAYNQDELDDILDMITPGPGSKADLPYSLNSLSDLEPKDVPVGAGIEQYREGKMKITKRQLEPMLSFEEAEMLAKKYRLNMSAQKLWDENRHSTYEELERRLEDWAGRMRPVR